MEFSYREKQFENDLLANFEQSNLINFLIILNQHDGAISKKANIIQSVFETLLTKKGSSPFVRACLVHGARPDKKNDQGRYSIHLATESCDEDILKVLLHYSEVLIDVTWNGKTAFDLYLEKGASAENQNVEKCVQQLIDRHALVNIDNLKIFLAKSNVSGVQSFVKNLLKMYIPDFEPGNQSVDYEIALNELAESTPWKLQNKLHELQGKFDLTEDEKQFISSSDSTVVQRFLELCIALKKLDAAEIIIAPFIDKNTHKLTNEKILPTEVLEKCCKVGNFEILDWLFEILDDDKQQRIFHEKGEGCLIQLVKKIDPRNEACPYFRCFELCLSNLHIEIDKVDNRNCTALHYATVHKLAHVQELLLQKGAYLGGTDDHGVHTICEIDPTVLENYFNSCIFTNGEDYASNERIYVSIRNFVPPYYKVKSEKLAPEPSNHKMCSNSSIMPALVAFTDESKISELSGADKQARQTLIEHPLISILLHLCSPIETNYTISFFKVLRTLPLVVLLILFCCDRELGIPWILFGVWFMFVCRIVFYLLESWNIVWNRISEIKKKISGGKGKQSIIHLLQQWVVYIRLAQIAILAWLVAMTIRSNYTAVLALATIQAGYEMTQYLASCDLFSESIYMLKVVLNSIWKNLVLFSFILVTFALSFNAIVRLENVTDQPNNLTTLAYTTPANVTLSGNANISTTPFDPRQQENLNNSTTSPFITQHREAYNVTIPHQHHSSNVSSLSDVKQSLLKVFVMFTGELDEEVFELKTNFNYVLVAVFVLFIVIVPIALANLLTALAVNDISKIRSQSKRLKISRNVQYVYRLEKFPSCLKSIINKYFLNDYQQINYIEMNPGKRNEIKLFRVTNSLAKTRELAKEDVPRSHEVNMEGEQMNNRNYMLNDTSDKIARLVQRARSTIKRN